MTRRRGQRGRGDPGGRPAAWRSRQLGPDGPRRMRRTGRKPGQGPRAATVPAQRGASCNRPNCAINLKNHYSERDRGLPPGTPCISYCQPGTGASLPSQRSPTAMSRAGRPRRGVRPQANSTAQPEQTHCLRDPIPEHFRHFWHIDPADMPAQFSGARPGTGSAMPCKPRPAARIRPTSRGRNSPKARPRSLAWPGARQPRGKAGRANPS